MKKEIKERLDENLTRVRNLVKIYIVTGRGRRRAGDTDVLRSATVLLHASLEDYLRSLARWKLPQINDEYKLNEIPFLSSEVGNRTEKVKLGYFVKYKNKTVEYIIDESINQYLDRSNFNNTTEISNIIKSLGVKVDDVDNEFSIIDEMINRKTSYSTSSRQR